MLGFECCIKEYKLSSSQYGEALQWNHQKKKKKKKSQIYLSMLWADGEEVEEGKYNR